MTAEEIQKNLLGVLTSTVTSRAAVRNNDAPFQGDKLAHDLAVDQISKKVDAVYLCCKVAGIQEDTIRNIISLCSL